MKLSVFNAHPYDQPFTLNPRRRVHPSEMELQPEFLITIIGEFRARFVMSLSSPRPRCTN